MSLPGQFIAQIETLQNFRKAPIRILPSSTAAEVKSNGYIKFILPVGAVLDLKTLCMHFDAATLLGTNAPTVSATAATNVCVGFPKYMQSLIQTLEVSINGKNVTQISEYGRVYHLLQSFRKNRDRKLGNNVDPSLYSSLANTGAITTFATKNIDTSGNADVNGSKGSYIIDEWLGFLNGSPSIVDTNILGQIELTMRLYPGNSVLWGQLGNGAAYGGGESFDFILSNIVLYCDKIDFKDSNYYNSIASLVSSESGFKIAFKNYMYYQGDAKTDNKNSLTKITESTQCLDKIIYTSYDNTAAAIAGKAVLQLGNNTSYLSNYVNNSAQLLNTSLYFKRNGTGVGTVEFELNSQSITQPLGVTNQWQETLKAFEANESDDWGREVDGSIRDLNHYIDDFYVCALSTSHINAKNKNTMLMSGIDTQASSMNISVRSIQGTLVANNAQANVPVIITEMTSFLVVNGQRQIMFVR
jgi:hypothetical protein